MSVRLPEEPCLGCGKAVDAATAVDGEVVGPDPGDVTICWYCGHWMAFDQNLRLRELTVDEMIELAGNPQLLAVSRAIHKRNQK